MTRLFLAVAALALAAGAAQAAPPADLVAAYKAGVAAVKCDLQLSSEASSQLGDAVQKIEQKSGLAQADLDALWAETEQAADADAAGFCANADKLVAKVIKSAK
jgi:hypothetical protein